VEYPQQSDLTTPEERREQVWRALLAWYAAEGRAHLPWRETRDPYAILVSEIMLQQTQVERVLPKYREFLARFPTFAALAAEPAGEAIKAWAGLGYNQRAVRSHGIARQVVEERALVDAEPCRDVGHAPRSVRRATDSTSCPVVGLSNFWTQETKRRLLLVSAHDIGCFEPSCWYRK